MSTLKRKGQVGGWVILGTLAAAISISAYGIDRIRIGGDGAKGLLALSQAGAHTIAQDEATCTVFGMPRAAISLGAAGVVAPIARIAQHALRKVA